MSSRSKAPRHRSGFVSLLGRPNTGKSTLLNQLVGQKLAIVADKPQTTRTTIQGAWTTKDAQVIFLDTPGIHESETLINRRMMQTIGEALQERDLLLLLVDVTRPPRAEDERAVALVAKAGLPAFAVLNKIDRLEDKRTVLTIIDHYRALHSFEEYFPISALTSEGLPDLKKAILDRMPVGPAYFPEDFVTDQPERFLAAELIREKILHVTRQEVPHAVAVLVDQWEETPRLTRIAATIYVERPGQKAIIVGEKGTRLKQVGTEARVEMENLLGRRIFLTLFVKVQPGWRENPSFLKDLDWRAMLGSSNAASATQAEPVEGPLVFDEPQPKAEPRRESRGRGRPR